MSTIESSIPPVSPALKSPIWAVEKIRGLALDDFVARSQPFLHADTVAWPAAAYDPAVFDAMAPLVQERVKTLSEVPGYVDRNGITYPVDMEYYANHTITGVKGVPKSYLQRAGSTLYK